MKVIDMHCDTIGELYKNTKLKNKENTFLHNDMHIDIGKLKEGEYFLQNFALFINLKETHTPFDTCVDMIKYWDMLTKIHNAHIKVVRSYNDIEESDKRIRGMLTLEEGECTEGNPDKLRELYRAGVRMMTITWNYENSLGYPATPRDIITGQRLQPDLSRGLTKKGILIVEEMMKSGIITDVSHLSDGGFYDVLRISKKNNVPFVASHSNARSIEDNPRNLTNDMIKELGNTGGVIGLNFYPPFIKSDKKVCNEAQQMRQLEYMRLHLIHMINTGGIECVGLGSDFDGIDGELGIKDASKMQELYVYLRRNGFSENVLEHIFFKNVLRVYKEVLKN